MVVKQDNVIYANTWGVLCDFPPSGSDLDGWVVTGANCQLARSAELCSHGESGCSKCSVSPRQRCWCPVPGGAEEWGGALA